MASYSSSIKVPFILGGRYKLVKKIGRGGFGDVHLGIDILNGNEVAVKLQKNQGRLVQLLLHEYKVYKTLQGGDGIPHVMWYGTERGYNVLVMQLLGPSLEDLFKLCSSRFTIKTVVMLAVQMIKLIEYIHGKGYIHRDIKPDNFLMGVGDHSNKLYLIDFGLAKKWKLGPSWRTTHIPYLENKKLTGTERYASRSAHAGIEQSRRDDMESLCYVMIYFIRGRLPWQGLKAVTVKQRIEKILEKKMSIDSLCEGVPAEFAIYLNYCRRLRFTEAPHYKYLRELFSSLCTHCEYTYDWLLLK